MKSIVKMTTLAVMAGLMIAPAVANAQLKAVAAGRDDFTENMIRNGNNDTTMHGYSPTTRYDRWDNDQEQKRMQNVNYRQDYYDPSTGTTVTRSTTTTTTY